MGRVNRKKRRISLQIKRNKREKVHALAERLQQTTDPKERTKLLEKIRRISPFYPIPGTTPGKEKRSS